MGITLFASSSRILSPLSTSKQNFISRLNSATPRGGEDICIPCGLDKGVSDIVANGRTTPGANIPVTRIFIFFTAGGNNLRSADLPSSILNTRNNDIITFAVGVGGYVLSELVSIASDIARVQTVFTKQNLVDLPQVVDELTKKTCRDLPGNPCGPGCQGFCSCGGQCLCPDSCDDGNACIDDTCQIGGNGNGCTHSPITCDDGNACTQNKCNPSTGCYFADPITCDDFNACTENHCNPDVGCSFPNIVCDDKDPCTVNKCFPATGCDFTEEVPDCELCKGKSCPQENCVTSTCNVLTGTCEESSLNCDDNSKCTIDSCDLDSGECIYTVVDCDDDNACTIDSCDPMIGCIHTHIDPTVDCNDHSVCTTDACDPTKGCVNTPIVCDDNDPCTTNECSSLFGCYHDPLDCRASPEFAGRELGDCHIVICDPTQPNPCVLQLLPNTTHDECQVCNGDGSTCKQSNSEPLDFSAAVGIGGGLIAAIAIITVVAFMQKTELFTKEFLPLI